MNGRILVVAAHPDDEVLGCGGTLLGSTRAGQEACIMILGEGNTSRQNQREQADAERVKRLHDDAGTVADLLGAKTIHFGNLPDNRFDQVALLDIVKIVERVVRDFQPTIIFTHHPGDLNIDHSISFRAVITATRPVKGQFVKKILTFEVPSSTEWAFQQIHPPFRPNTFVDVAATIDKKIEGMEKYETEKTRVPASALGRGTPSAGTEVGIGSRTGIRRSVRACALHRTMT